MIYAFSLIPPCHRASAQQLLQGWPEQAAPKLARAAGGGCQLDLRLGGRVTTRTCQAASATVCLSAAAALGPTQRSSCTGPFEVRIHEAQACLGSPPAQPAVLLGKADFDLSRTELSPSLKSSRSDWHSLHWCDNSLTGCSPYSDPPKSIT